MSWSGASALAADYQGTSQASHVRDKLAEMTHLAETIYTGSIACSAMGHKTKAGNWEPDTLLANTTKYNVSKNIYEVARLAHDLAGGIIATLPFEDDLKNPEISKHIEKYMKGVNNVSTEDRIRLLRLIENMTGGTALVEAMHGAGSPQAQKVMYMRSGNIEQKKKTGEEAGQNFGKTRTKELTTESTENPEGFNLWTLKFLLRNSELGNPPQKSPPTPLCKGGQGGFLGRHHRSDFLVAALPPVLCGSFLIK